MKTFEGRAKRYQSITWHFQIPRIRQVGLARHPLKRAAFPSGHRRHTACVQFVASVRVRSTLAVRGGLKGAKGPSPDPDLDLIVNAGVKIPRFAGEKIHQCCWQEGPEVGAY